MGSPPRRSAERIAPARGRRAVSRVPRRHLRRLFRRGRGILVLALLALLGMENIHAMNGMKTLIVSVVNGVALVTFILAHIVLWPQALLMLVGASLGGYGGAHYAQKTDPKYIRWLVIAVGFGMSAYFFARY